MLFETRPTSDGRRTLAAYATTPAAEEVARAFHDECVAAVATVVACGLSSATTRRLEALEYALLSVPGIGGALYTTMRRQSNQTRATLAARAEFGALHRGEVQPLRFTRGQQVAVALRLVGGHWPDRQGPRLVLETVEGEMFYRPATLQLSDVLALCAPEPAGV